MFDKLDKGGIAVGELNTKKTTNDFASAWDDFSKKYNMLSDVLYKRGIDNKLLDEVIDSRTNFLKICLVIKFDEISKL